MHEPPSWAKTTLYLAGVYNIIWGITVIIFPIQLFNLAGMTAPNYPELFQCIGMMISVFGIAYITAAHDPFKHWPIVLAGLIGRILGPIGFVYAATTGAFPWMAGVTIITNDIIWLFPFSLILYQGHKQLHNILDEKPLYKRIISNNYHTLPKSIQQLHDYKGSATYKGKCHIKRGNNILVKLVANLISLPYAGDNVEVIVHLKTSGNKELWNRSFNGKTFRSIQWQKGDFLYEKLRFTKLIFKTITSDHGLGLDLQKSYFFGIPQIGCLRPKVIAKETEVNGKFHFFIQTSLPLFGLMIQYEGFLEKIEP